MLEEETKNYFLKKAKEFNVFSWDENGNRILHPGKFRTMVD